jgi:hypothetical protein
MGAHGERNIAVSPSPTLRISLPGTLIGPADLAFGRGVGGNGMQAFPGIGFLQV